MIQDVGRFRGADPLKSRRCTSNLQSSFPAHGSSLQFLMKGFIYTEKKSAFQCTCATQICFVQQSIVVQNMMENMNKDVNYKHCSLQ